MRILIYWEQEMWGGVDTHLLALLSSWPSAEDEFVLMVNEGNAGFERLRESFLGLPHMRCVVVPSYSHNELNRRFRGNPLLRRFSPLLHFVQPLTYRLSVRRMRKHFRNEGPFDLLLANNGAYPAAWGTIAAIEAAAQSDIAARLLLVHHAAKPAAAFMGWFENRIDRKISRLASAVICVSQATKNTLSSHRRLDTGILPIRVIPHDIVLSPPTGEPITDIRKTVAAPPHEKLVGIVGRIHDYKGHEDLILALNLLTLEERKALRLVVIGSGEAQECERLLKLVRTLNLEDRVHFLGYLPGRPTDLIAQLDLVAMVTRDFEGFGLTLAEAMTAGVPVLATRVGAIPEFVDETTGVLVNPKSPPEIAEAFRDFLSRPENWHRRAAAAKRRMELKGDTMSEKYRKLFLECLAAPAPSCIKKEVLA